MRIIKISETPFHEFPYRSSGRNETRNCILPFYFAYVDKLPNGIKAIVATSDLQGREQDHEGNRLLGEAVSEELILLQELNLIPKVDLIISVGDLYDRPELNKLGATGDVTSVLNSFSDRFPNVVAVHGNHDMVMHEYLNPNIEILDGTDTNVSGLSIGGVCGISGRNGRNQRKSPDVFSRYLNKIINRNNDLILLHQSPRGDLEDQKGDTATREILAKNGSSLLISGHCHWDNHISNIGGNQVLNVDSKVFVIVTTVD